MAIIGMCMLEILVPNMISTPAVDQMEQSVPYFGDVDSAVTEIIADGTCIQYLVPALQAGWQPEQLPRLMRIMFRESRCDPLACSRTDTPRVRRCRDWGLMQINDYSWKRVIRSLGLTMDQMHDPYWNLWFSRWLFEYSEKYYGDGWAQWKPVRQL